MENKLQNAGQNSIMDSFVKTDDILKDMCGIIESSQKAAHQAVNTLLVQRNWMIGYRIAEEEFGGQERSEYGLHVIKKLSKELTNRYGKGYDRGTLYRCLKFYKLFPEIVASLRQQSGAILSWTHYRILLQVEDKEARDWYEKEAAEQTWSVRTLQRNVSSQYYYRMLKTQKKELVENEMKELTASYQNDKLEFIKNPVVAEFLGFSQDTNFTESDLEKSILSNLQKFLMELGKGYELSDYIGTIEDEHLLRQINATLKKTFGLWVYKPEKEENVRCLCTKCLNDYIHNPDYIVRRLDPFAKVKDHCDKCNQSGWDYVVTKRNYKK